VPTAWSARTNAPSRVRNRNLASTSVASNASHTARSSPHNRCACAIVRRRPGISRYSPLTRRSTSSGCSIASSAPAGLFGKIVAKTSRATGVPMMRCVQAHVLTQENSVENARSTAVGDVEYPGARHRPWANRVVTAGLSCLESGHLTATAGTSPFLGFRGTSVAPWSPGASWL